jgi:hypothetical protein
MIIALHVFKDKSLGRNHWILFRFERKKRNWSHHLYF